MDDLVRRLRERDAAVRAHHERRTGKPCPAPMTLEGMAADEIETLRRVLGETARREADANARLRQLQN